VQICDLNGYSDKVIFISCAGVLYLKVASPSCTVRFKIGDHAQVTYDFGYDYFDQALEIHRKLLTLIASWAVK
jgi:hypothetical protein